MPTVTTNASAVFDEVIAKRKMKNDAELCRVLDVAPAMVSSMRAQRIVFGPAMCERILSRNLMSARRLKQLLES